MECKFAAICKFFQEGATCSGRVPWNKGLTKESDPILKRISEKTKIARAGEKPVEVPVEEIAQVKRKYRTRRKPGRKPGKKKAPAAVSGNAKEAEHAAKALQKRANKGKLTEEQIAVYDLLEPEIIGLPVARWPDGYSEMILELYKDVIKEEV